MYDTMIVFDKRKNDSWRVFNVSYKDVLHDVFVTELFTSDTTTSFKSWNFTKMINVSTMQWQSFMFK